MWGREDFVESNLVSGRYEGEKEIGRWVRSMRVFRDKNSKGSEEMAMKELKEYIQKEFLPFLIQNLHLSLAICCQIRLCLPSTNPTRLVQVFEDKPKVNPGWYGIYAQSWLGTCLGTSVAWWGCPGPWPWFFGH